MSSFYSLIFITLLVSSSATSFHEASHQKPHTRPKRINADIGQVPLARQSLSSKTVYSIETPPNPVYLLSDESGNIIAVTPTSHPYPSSPAPTKHDEDAEAGVSTSPSGESTTDASATPTSLPNVTGNPSTTTPTSTEPPATSTPEVPPTTEIPPRIPGFGESTKGFVCLCDLQWNVCERNCCCDPDCSDEDKKTFTACSDSVIYNQNSKQRNDRDCVKSYIMYDYHMSYESYRVDRKQNGLFCVVKDNSKQTTEFSQNDMERITRRVIRKEIDLKPKYTWGVQPPSVSDENYNLVGHEPYKYGSEVWTQEFTDDLFVSSHFVPLRFPTSFHKDICSIHEPVKYLQDSVSGCARPISNLETQCQTFHELDVKFYTEGYSVVINPKKKDINSTKYQTQEIYSQKECYNGHCIPSSEADTEPFFNFRRPEWDEHGATCRNVLSRLNLTVYHAGIEGITSVVAKADLTEIPQGATHVWQEFNVEFVWSKLNNPIPPVNNTNATTLTAPVSFPSDLKFPRSGNPGYIVGKPVILGRKMEEIKPVSNDSKEYTTIERIRVLADKSQWLHIQGAGDCPNTYTEALDARKNPVLFGYEHASTCKLLLAEFEHCEQLQRHIASIFFGTDDPLSFTKAPLYVAAYGSPDAFPSDWVPLTFIGISKLFGTSPFSSTSLISGCDGIITGVHITIAYAYVGSVDAPQAKIVGVFYEPEDSFPLPAAPSCSDEPTLDISEQKCRTITDLGITTTVSFMDVSGEPITKVATWPVVSVRLPSDFYYPFSTSSPASSFATRQNLIQNLVEFVVIIVVMFR